MNVKVAQLFVTLGDDPMGYTVHRILQVRILEWAAFPFSRGSSQPRDQTQVSCIAGRFSTSWATREALAWDVFCTRYPLILANYILYMVLTFTALSSQTTLCSSSLFELQKGGPSTIYKRQWTQILDYWTARFSYWATWLSAYDCFWTMQEKEYKILTPLFLITYPCQWALILYNPPDSSWNVATVLEAQAYCVLPFSQLRIKDNFLFMPNPASVGFYSTSVGRESQDCSPVATAEFSKYAGILSAALKQHCLLEFEIAGIPSPPLALFIVLLPTARLTSHSMTSAL